MGGVKKDLLPFTLYICILLKIALFIKTVVIFIFLNIYLFILRAEGRDNELSLIHI